MSPVSRGRKKNKSARRRGEPLFVMPEAPCDCPACTGSAEVDPQEMIDGMLASAADLLEVEDPLEAELIGATVATVLTLPSDDDGLAPMLVAQLAAPGSPAALALLLGVSAVAPDRIAEIATAATDRLATAGVPRPTWADELTEPVTASDCQAITDAAGTGTILAGAFHRAGRAHAILLVVDELECGAAVDIALTPVDELPNVLAQARADGRRAGTKITVETLDPAEFRWRVETALNARAVHDEETPPDPDELLLDEDDGPGYAVLAALLRARLAALPAPTKPPAPHGDAPGTRLEKLAALMPPGKGRRGGGQVRGAKLPAKRKKSAGPAPIYQLKVSLLGTKPPIWRRLEVPADIGLSPLHGVLQAAFDWEDCHLHAYETPFGRFGDPDPDLDQRSARSVTLEQVAPSAGDKIVYMYDFGDGWEHEIVVEKALDPDPAATYPRCTGGRRAAPPEDCGGVWGYASLIDTLANPDDPEHDSMLDWLGLENAADFDPAAFDPAEVNKALS